VVSGWYRGHPSHRIEDAQIERCAAGFGSGLRGQLIDFLQHLPAFGSEIRCCDVRCEQSEERRG
jgi:hypothetical protein